MLRSFCLAGMALLIIPASALGQADDGVTIDPDSPAGKQYAIPLEEARSEGAGEPGGSPGAAAPRGSAPTAGTDSESAPLFGEGIDRRKRIDPGEPDRTTEARGAPALAPRTATTGVDGGTPSLALIAGALVALGACVGLGARKFARRS